MGYGLWVIGYGLWASRFWILDCGVGIEKMVSVSCGLRRD
jgi:hypothetical protein